MSTSPALRLLYWILSGAFLIASGFLVTLAAASGSLPVMLAFPGFVVMLFGVSVIGVGLFRFVTRKPSEEEQSLATSADTSTMHLTPPGLMVLMLLIVGIPAATMGVEQLNIDRDLILVGLSIAYCILGSLLVLPACRHWVYMPSVEATEASREVVEEKLQQSREQLLPLFFVAGIGIVGLGLVLLFSSDDPKSHQAGVSALIFGAIYTGCLLHPKVRRRMSRRHRR